jgi:hypothetical protein
MLLLPLLLCFAAPLLLLLLSTPADRLPTAVWRPRGKRGQSYDPGRRGFPGQESKRRSCRDVCRLRAAEVGSVMPAPAIAFGPVF